MFQTSTSTSYHRQKNQKGWPSNPPHDICCQSRDSRTDKTGWVFCGWEKSGRVDEANSIRMVADDFITWARTPPDSVMPEISGWATRLRRQKGWKTNVATGQEGSPVQTTMGCVRLDFVGRGGVFMRCKIILRPRRSSDHGFSHGGREQLWF